MNIGDIVECVDAIQTQSGLVHGALYSVVDASTAGVRVSPYLLTTPGYGTILKSPGNMGYLFKSRFRTIRHAQDQPSVPKHDFAELERRVAVLERSRQAYNELKPMDTKVWGYFKDPEPSQIPGGSPWGAVAPDPEVEKFSELALVKEKLKQTERALAGSIAANETLRSRVRYLQKCRESLNREVEQERTANTALQERIIKARNLL